MKLIKQHYLAIIVTIVLVILGMTQTIVGYWVTPPDRVFTGMQGFSDDYVGYVSYIKEGMYGRNSFILRSIPVHQTPTTIHLTYVILGKIGGLFGLDAPLIYHLARAGFGFIFALLIYRLFLTGFKNKQLSVLGLILAFCASSVGWFTWGPSGEPVYKTLSTFNFTDMAFGRITNRPHYLLGAILFLVIIQIFLNKKYSVPKAGLALGLISLVLGTVHPTFAILMVLICAVLTIIDVIEHKRLITKKTFIRYIPVVAGAMGGLFLSYWSMRQYPLQPNIWLDFYAYKSTFDLNQFINDILVFGPILWLGITGLLLSIKKSDDTGVNIMQLIWLVVQLALFLFLYRIFRSDRVRFVQSLYFIPMAYGTILFLKILDEKIRKGILIIGFFMIMILTGSSYIEWWVKSIGEYTDFREFSVFPYPTKGQFEAIRYLDTNSPKESTVLVYWEVSNLILIYSHNMVLGNKQGWPAVIGKQMEDERDMFFKNMMSPETALEYIKKNKVMYVYYGYQEKYQGLDPNKYRFLQPVFSNNDATIFKVNL